jgi:hypothetical protein
MAYVLDANLRCERRDYLPLFCARLSQAPADAEALCGKWRAPHA